MTTFNLNFQAIKTQVNEILSSGYTQKADTLLEEISHSNISPFYTETKREFLAGFSDSLQYCKDAILGETELWEKKEYMAVIEANISELNIIEEWFTKMKELKLA